MLIFLEIPHKNGIILSQRGGGVQANHMNPLCIRHCRSLSCIINKEIRLNKYFDIISFFFMGPLCCTHMGPIWANRIWDNPYGTHAETGCTPHIRFHMGSPYGTHICMFSESNPPHTPKKVFQSVFWLTLLALYLHQSPIMHAIRVTAFFFHSVCIFLL